MSDAWRFVDDLDGRYDAAAQMRADLDLFRHVAGGALPALRCYRWVLPALSLGRFQDDADIDRDACVRHGIDVVRRPTGGRALLHGGDLTYAVALRPSPRYDSVDAIYRWLARGLVAGLRRIGVDAAVARHDGASGPVCFNGQQGSDLRVGDRKVCGSAQLRSGGTVLQHGSILLHRLDVDETDLLRGSHDREHLRRVTVTLEELGAPTDPRVVAEAIVDGFERALDITFVDATAPLTRMR